MLKLGISVEEQLEFAKKSWARYVRNKQSFSVPPPSVNEIENLIEMQFKTEL